MHLVAIQEVPAPLEPGHVAGPGVLAVPAPGNHRRVLLVEDRVEDRLTGKARWPPPPPGRLNQRQLLRSGRSPQGHRLPPAAHPIMVAGPGRRHDLFGPGPEAETGRSYIDQ